MSTRLDLLRPYLSKLNRRFSVFSLGSGVEDGLEHEIAREFDCVVVCAEKDPLRYIPTGRMMVLRKEFSADDLFRFSECEHFDVVLAMNILHWYEAHWNEALTALSLLGDRIFMQSPYPEDTQACGKHNTSIMQRIADGKRLGETAQFGGHMPRPIFTKIGSTDLLTRKSFNAEEQIEATVINGTIMLHHKDEVQKYIPGLTLTTFAELNGVWPPKEMICSALRLMKWDGPHRDIQPWNVRITGTEAFLIDPGGADWPDSDEANRRALLEWAEKTLTPSQAAVGQTEGSVA